MPKNFDDSFNDLVKSEEVNELLKELKWTILLGMISDKELQDQYGVEGEKVRPFYEFFKVFKEHNIDPDIVIEAIGKLIPNEPKPDISKDELTSFVSVLDKLRKKGETDVCDQKKEDK